MSNNEAKVIKDAKLTELNSEAYHEKNIKSSKQIEINYPDGKVKYIKETLYNNGTKKRKVVGMKKGEKIIFDKGIE